MSCRNFVECIKIVVELGSYCALIYNSEYVHLYGCNCLFQTIIIVYLVGIGIIKKYVTIWLHISW